MKKAVAIFVMLAAIAGAYVCLIGSGTENRTWNVEQQNNIQYKCTACGQIFTYGPNTFVPSKCPSCGKGILMVIR